MRNATLVFDLDGTLVDTAPDLILAVNHALTSRGLEPVPAERLQPEISFGGRHMIATGLKLRGVSFTETELDRDARSLSRILCRQHRCREPSLHWPGRRA